MLEDIPENRPSRYQRPLYRRQPIEISLVGGLKIKAGTAMSRILALVKRHPLTTFFILAYALSWWAWILYALGLFPNPIASFGPFLAAIVVLALTQGKAGLLGLFRRMGRWRIPPGWYVVALLLPAVLAAAAAVLNVLLGAEAPSG